jgi:putative ABC transport system permease protein
MALVGSTCTQAILLSADIPVFCGIGGGITQGKWVVNLALHAEFQGAIGVVLNAPTSNETVAAVRETTYYGALAHFFQPVEALGWTMAVLVVVSGLFGGLNTMVAAVASRSRELACLETLGFGRTALVVSLLEESLLQVAGGALLAAVGALGLLSGKAVRFSMSAAELRVDAPVLAAGFVAGVLLAAGATLIPALRQMRTPLVELLRS